MEFKKFKINKEKEKVQITFDLDFDELRNISRVLKYNEGCYDSFENITVKFNDYDKDNDELSVKAYILEAPNRMSRSDLDKFLNFLYQWNYIHFPLGDGYCI